MLDPELVLAGREEWKYELAGLLGDERADETRIAAGERYLRRGHARAGGIANHAA
jgi:hypothetical protein